MVYAAVAVTVGDEDVAVAADGNAGRHIEGTARLFHKGPRYLARVRGHISRAQREQQVAFGITLLDHMRVPVRQINVSSFTYTDAVCLLMLQVPRVEVIAFSIEDYDIVRATVIDIHIVVAVHRDIRDLLELEAFRQLSPALCYFVHVIAASECHIIDLPNQ